MDQHDVETELYLDRMLYGVCFWRLVDGAKVRVPPPEVKIRDDGTLLGADEIQKHSDSATAVPQNEGQK